MKFRIKLKDGFETELEVDQIDRDYLSYEFHSKKEGLLLTVSVHNVSVIERTDIKKK